MQKCPVIAPEFDFRPLFCKALGIFPVSFAFLFRPFCYVCQHVDFVFAKRVDTLAGDMSATRHTSARPLKRPGRESVLDQEYFDDLAETTPCRATILLRRNMPLASDVQFALRQFESMMRVPLKPLENTGRTSKLLTDCRVFTAHSRLSRALAVARWSAFVESVSVCHLQTESVLRVQVPQANFYSSQ